MSMDFDLPFTGINEFIEWVQQQLGIGGTGLPGGTGSAA